MLKIEDHVKRIEYLSSNSFCKKLRKSNYLIPNNISIKNVKDHINYLYELNLGNIISKIVIDVEGGFAILLYEAEKDQLICDNDGENYLCNFGGSISYFKDIRSKEDLKKELKFRILK